MKVDKPDARVPAWIFLKSGRFQLGSKICWLATISLVDLSMLAMPPTINPGMRMVENVGVTNGQVTMTNFTFESWSLRLSPDHKERDR